MKQSVIIASLIIFCQIAAADTTEVVVGNPQVGNTIPFWGSGYAANRFQTVFLQSAINRQGRIIKLAIMPDAGVNASYNNLRFSLCHTNRSNNISATFDDNYDGFTPELMFDSVSCTLIGAGNQWLEFPVSFNYNNTNNLLLEIRWRGSSGQNTYIYVHYIQNTETYRVFNLGNDSAVTGSADYVRYYVKLTIESQTGTEEIVIGKPAAAGLTVLPTPARIGTGVVVTGAGASADIQVFDTNGRRVRMLDRGSTVRWDLRDEQDLAVPAGVYLIQAGALRGRAVVIKH